MRDDNGRLGTVWTETRDMDSGVAKCWHSCGDRLSKVGSLLWEMSHYRPGSGRGGTCYYSHVSLLRS